MSRPHTSLIRSLQATTIFLPIFASGFHLAASILLIPRLLESPTPLMLRQFKKMLSFDKFLYPATVGPTQLALCLLAWHVRGWSSRRTMWLYLATSLLCSGLGLFMNLVMMPTNRKILGKAGNMEGAALLTEEVEETGQREESAKWLVDHWGVLNLPRGIVMGLSGVLGLVAAL